MSTTTTNYNLVKPELTDPADITKLNPNWDFIDSMLHDLETEGWLTPVTKENEDLDNYTTQGIYSFGSAYAPINRPADNSNGWLIVIPWNNNPTVGTVKQLWLRHGTLNSNDHCLYVRTRIGSNNAWSTWAQIYTNKEVNAVIANYLPLSGGVMTGNIQHKRGDVISTPIRISESGNGYGNFLQIGAGGDVIIGSGESFTGIATAEDIDGSQENMYVGSDGEIIFFTNCNAIGNRKKITMDTSGRIKIPDNVVPSNPYHLTTKKYVDDNKLDLTGGTMTGPIEVNDSGFKAITKIRSFNDVPYTATYGCGAVAGKGAVAMEISENNVVVGRLEVSQSGVSFMDANSKRHYLHTASVIQATLE